MKMVIAALILVHSWYPEECCGGGDCEVVTYVRTDKATRSIIVKTPDDREVTISRKVNRKMSEDGKYHLCYNHAQLRLYHDPVIYCFFVPGEA